MEEKIEINKEIRNPNSNSIGKSDKEKSDQKNHWWSRTKGEGKTSKMRLMMVLFIGYRNLRVNKLRSFLTIGGVAVGIGIVTFLICLGFGIQMMVVNEVTKNNAEDVIDIANTNLENFVLLNDETINRLKILEGIKEVEVLVNTGGKVYYSEAQTDSIIYGAEQNYFNLASRRLNDGDLNNFTKDNSGMIISSRLARILTFSSNQDAIDKEIEFDMVLSNDISKTVKKESTTEKVKGKIIGVINNDQEAFLYAPHSFIKEKFQVDSAQSAKIRIDISRINQIRSDVEQMGFVTESVVDIVKDINSFFTIIRVVMIILGTIIMSISAMGMMNTLSVSLLQRTKEVGILKALGAKRKDIFKMFVFEAAIISFSGGIIGFFSGWAGAKLINLIFNLLAKQRGFSTLDFVYIPSYFILVIVIFILFLGMATGILPAKRASRIHALDALRYE
jgi:putative ABC transport system permease protein